MTKKITTITADDIALLTEDNMVRVGRGILLIVDRLAQIIKVLNSKVK